MADFLHSRFRRCCVSAPFGLDLGVLPKLLAERQITWEWAKDGSFDRDDASSRIATADFSIVVLNGSRSDYRGAFDAGLAVALKKPVFLIQTKARALPLDLRLFTTVRSNLSNREALSFHLDLFLTTPAEVLAGAEAEHSAQHQPLLRSKVREARRDRTHGSAWASAQRL